MLEPSRVRPIQEPTGDARRAMTGRVVRRKPTGDARRGMTGRLVRRKRATSSCVCLRLRSGASTSCATLYNIYGPDEREWFSHQCKLRAGRIRTSQSAARAARCCAVRDAYEWAARHRLRDNARCALKQTTFPHAQTPAWGGPNKLKGQGSGRSHVKFKGQGQGWMDRRNEQRQYASTHRTFTSPGPWPLSQSVSQFQDFDVTVRGWEVEERFRRRFTPLVRGLRPQSVKELYQNPPGRGRWKKVQADV